MSEQTPPGNNEYVTRRDLEKAIDGLIGRLGEISSLTTAYFGPYDIEIGADEEKKLSELVSTFDARMTDVEKQLDRVLARLGVD